MTSEKTKILRKKIEYRKKRKDFGQAINSFFYCLPSTVCFKLQDILFFFAKKEEEPLTRMTEEKYKEIFLKGRSKQDIENSYKKAWEAKNFEIELYWKRATYFWAFQIASFTGYFTVLNSNNYTSTPHKHPEVLYLVICIGFITSVAWALINQGSKVWQRHWEIHVDMLEDAIAGPLYKIVTTPKTFSVSKINDIVSRFVVLIWLLIGVKYFIDHLTLHPLDNDGINWQITIATIITIYFIGSMFLGYGRGRFGERKVKFYERKFKTK